MFEYLDINSLKWATRRIDMSSGAYEQQRRRLACVSAQSDQSLCYLLIGKRHIKTCYKRNFNTLTLVSITAGWFESHFV